MIRTLHILFKLFIFMSLPKGAASDILSVPMFHANLREFSRHAEPCDASIRYSSEDVIFSLSPLVFYRSANSCEVLGGEQFCKTFITSLSNEGRCLGYVYSNGSPLYGRSENQRSESIILNTPSGGISFPNENFRGE
jgi:hypothetical protein